MVTKMFNDTIYSATELKKNQRACFEKAYRHPVSITSSRGRNFVLINREQISNIYRAKEYGEELIRYCYDIKKETMSGEFDSAVFPWAKHLSGEERMIFSDELIKAFAQSISTNNWDVIGEVLSEWRATAEALTNTQFMEVVDTNRSDRSYTDID